MGDNLSSRRLNSKNTKGLSPCFRLETANPGVALQPERPGGGSIGHGQTWTPERRSDTG